MAEHPAPRRRHRRAWLLAVGAAVVIVGGLGGLGGVLAADALAARAALLDVADALPRLEQQLRTDPASAQQDLTDLQERTHEAARRTSGLRWELATHVPVWGDDAAALATIAATADQLATRVLPRLSAAAQAVTPQALAPRDGRVDLSGLAAVRDDVVAADRALGGAIEQIGAVDRDGLVGALADAADQLQGRLGRVRVTTATAARAVQLLPPMLGEQGPREWLVLAQNNAEPRATGGIPGAVLLLRADDGVVEHLDTVSTTQVGQFPEPVLPLTDAERALFGDGLGRWLQDVTFTPDFPRSAELAAQMWRQLLGGEPRGVVSIDPVALQALVSGTGPVTFADPAGAPITLTGENTAEFLMSTIYARYPEAAVQDAVFASAAEAVFTALTGGGAAQGDGAAGAVDAPRVVGALADAAAQGRLMVWSADAAEQALLAGTVLSGELRGTRPTTDGELSPVVGAFLNLTTAGKLGFYLDAAYDVEGVSLRDNGSQAMVLRVRLTNLLADGEAAGLPAYVTGSTPGQGTISAVLSIYAPANGTVRSVTSVTGLPVDVLAQVHDELPVVAHPLDIAPGATADLRFEIVSGPDQRGAVHVRATPGARS